VTGGQRARPPRSANGASSFHLTWEFSQDSSTAPGFVEVSAVLEILVPPSVKALYFWALQVDFAGAGGVLGGAHTGLQWNARYSHGKAVNWGGYASAERGGFVLTGTESELPGFPDDPNTLGYRWEPGRHYRLRVFRSPERLGAWRSEITDLSSGVVSTIRDLLPGEGAKATDSYLLRPVVWSEVFADCDAPSVTVRWSDLRALDQTGALVCPTAVRVNYQAWESGGCPNTTVAAQADGGVLQITNTVREVKQGATLKLPAERS
jgi:hypothetical protein